MLGMVLSKATMFIAASLILVSMLGFFQAQRGILLDGEVQSIADQLAEWVNEMNTQFTEVALNITFGSEGGGHALPVTLSNGNTYTIQFLQHQVVVHSDTHSKDAPIFRELHFWSPCNASYTTSEIGALDRTQPSLEVESLGSITLTRKCVKVDHEIIWMSFAISE